jgi:hypothetical protein
VDFNMDDTLRGFYDAFADEYHLIFGDWEASMTRQAASIGSILERECGPATFHHNPRLRLWYRNAGTRIGQTRLSCYRV